MEGLLIAEELQEVQGSLPSRRQAWRFPDPHTFVLPLEGGSLWLLNRPPDPRLEWRPRAAPPPAGRATGFQSLLAARAAGELIEIRQHALDRVVSLRFGPAGGFVETDPVTLKAELTGRNCNLILVDERGVVLGAAREVRADVNRYRQVVAGRPYTPPPPYEKLDPRSTEASSLAAALQGRPLTHARQVVDGLGPQLTRVLAQLAGVVPERPLDGEELERVVVALQRLVERPSMAVAETTRLPGIDELRRQERRQLLRQRVESVVRRELAAARKRLGDISRARQAASAAAELRQRADLLLGNAHAVPAGAPSIALPGLDGRLLEIPLDPALDAVRNAQKLYERARKREARAAQATSREPELRRRQVELEDLLATLDELPEAQLEELAERLAPATHRETRSGPGIRYRGPHGFSVLVGRNSRDNDEVTFRVARSRDVWLHVQGYRGSHVIIQAENREVPFDTIVFAAQLAAGHSRAVQSDNVPVDYTLRKNVWKVKGQPPGAVNFAHQKTVYVTPRRHVERS